MTYGIKSTLASSVLITDHFVNARNILNLLCYIVTIYVIGAKNTLHKASFLLAGADFSVLQVYT